MILAVDVDYRTVGAVAAGVLFAQWADSKPLNELRVPVSQVEAYKPGEFYKRELPCIMSILNTFTTLPEFMIIDGHVYLDRDGKGGLGKHLFDAIGRKSVVIGVAKSRFKDTPKEAELFRAGSRRALYVTAAGTDISTAKQNISQMHGPYRLPTLLKHVDRLSRG